MNDADILGFKPNSPILAYDVTTFLDTLPAYNTCEQGSLALDLARDIIRSNDYYYYGFPFPNNFFVQDGRFVTTLALETITGSLAIAPYSYLTSMSFWVQPIEGNPDYEFKIRIYDKGAKTDLFYNRFAQSQTVVGKINDPDLRTVNRLGDNEMLPGPYMFTSPMIILPPGSLQIEITNLTGLDRLIQVMFNFAIPINKRNTNLNALGEST